MVSPKETVTTTITTTSSVPKDGPSWSEKEVVKSEITAEKDDSEYVELLDDEIIREIQINRSVKSSELKEYARKNPGSNLDWFLKGNIDQLRDNLGKVTTQTDIASIETRIAILEKVSL